MKRRVVVYADGPDGPLPDPGRIAGDGPVEVYLGWVVRTPPWLEPGVELADGVSVTTLMAGPGLRRAVADGRVRSVPTRLSAVPGLLAGRLRPDVAVVGAVEPRSPSAPASASASAPGGWRLVGSPGWAMAAVEAATEVIVERWALPAGAGLGSPAVGLGSPAAGLGSPAVGGGRRPLVVGAPLPAERITGIVERSEPPDAPPIGSTSPAHSAIGRLVAGLVPEGATIQWGPGAVGAAVVGALDQPVRVRSGLVTDELVELDRRGLLVGAATAAYVWGGPDLADMVDARRLILRPVEWTHDLTAISATERFVAINTALQVGLDGSVNIETAGGRIVSGPGGHPDFAAAASRSPGGLSIVALPSVVGGHPTIVVRPEVVSTPGCDVDVVVTEHGVADLRNATPAERAERIRAVADPAWREGLAG